MLVCAWAGWDVPFEVAGAEPCACAVPGVAVVEAEGAGVVVVSGVFWVAGPVWAVELVGVWVGDAAGAVLVPGDCANAAVAKTRPTAVLMRKRVFMACFLQF